jgi:hypothetical protein
MNFFCNPHCNTSRARHIPAPFGGLAVSWVSSSLSSDTFSPVSYGSAEVTV